MEHLRDELDAGGFVRVLLFEVHDEPEGAVFEGSVRGADDDCVPGGAEESIQCLWGRRRMGGGGCYHVITLSAIGLALTPAGGSVCMRLKSRIRRLRAAVDILRLLFSLYLCGSG